MKDEILTGLDIGSHSIKIVIGQRVQNSAGKEDLQIIGLSTHQTEGMSKGIITSIEDAVSSISACLEKAERMAGVAIGHALVSINGTHIISQPSRGVIAVSRPNGEINEDDVERVIDAAQTVATPPNYEILHVIPRTFIVDNQTGIKDPVGMTGIRLEVEAQIIQGLSTQIKNLTKAVYRTGIEIDDLVLSSLACADSVLTKRQKELGVALVNIGATTTNLVVIEEGDVIHTAVLPVGAGHITSDIAIGLRIDIDAAEAIKLQYGTAAAQLVSKGEEINLAEFGLDEEMVSRKHIVEIISARLDEIFSMVDRELKKINRSGLLPSGVVLTGGGAKLHGIVDSAKLRFKLPASVGVPQAIVTPVEKVNDPTYSVASGLVQWGYNMMSQNSQTGFGKITSFKDVSSKVTGWFKNLIP